tara:strand:- start:1144 stop:1332 length:189 start_codon:yes stop_codon:yes gene_type:complete
MKKPKSWGTRFAANVIKAYKEDEFNLEDSDSIERWDTRYNGGNKPNPAFETKEVVKYWIKVK